MKRAAVIIIASILFLFACTGCVSYLSDGQTAEADGVNKALSMPYFFDDMGKTLNTLKNEHPEAEYLFDLDFYLNAWAACLGEPEGEYAYFFFGGQDGNAELALDMCGDVLVCAGFWTTTDILFPEMEDDMTFEEFFSLIGVSDYTLYVDVYDDSPYGWLGFDYNGMEVIYLPHFDDDAPDDLNTIDGVYSYEYYVKSKDWVVERQLGFSYSGYYLMQLMDGIVTESGWSFINF